MKRTKARKLNQVELRRRRIDAAMPEVKRLVRKHSRQIIQSCLHELRDFERSLEELETARANVQALERKVGRK